MPIFRICPEGSPQRPGLPEIFNPDQGTEFASAAFTGMLKANGIRNSMDGRGRCKDNIFSGRLWRSLKYEEVYLHAYETIPEARAGICSWVRFYHTERSPRCLNGDTPNEFIPERVSSGCQML